MVVVTFSNHSNDSSLDIKSNVGSFATNLFSPNTLLKRYYLSFFLFHLSESLSVLSLCCTWALTPVLPPYCSVWSLPGNDGIWIYTFFWHNLNFFCNFLAPSPLATSPRCQRSFYKHMFRHLYPNWVIILGLYNCISGRITKKGTKKLQSSWKLCNGL